MIVKVGLTISSAGTENSLKIPLVRRVFPDPSSPWSSMSSSPRHPEAICPPSCRVCSGELENTFKFMDPSEGRGEVIHQIFGGQSDGMKIRCGQIGGKAVNEYRGLQDLF